AEHVQKSFDQMDTTRTRRVLLEGWEKFHEPVDRIVSIGAFEHFGRQRYGRFFKMAYNALPPGGIMLLHTIVRPSFKDARAKGLSLTHEIVEFSKFILAEIFPGGWLPTPQTVGEYGVTVGFELTRVQSLRLHYARTLDLWAEALEANREQALAIQSQEIYDKYMHYLTGCENFFRKGISNVGQFTLVK
ncbi:SAM-dependent methyltransferase, partial [Mycobacterium intracellulare]|uniref:class I SAM-dependent methyltransferase n=1 Tax=Mycobacterium intracellulare TaxID=1767 RepID=UPI0007E94F97